MTLSSVACLKDGYIIFDPFRNTLHHWNELALCLVLSGILHRKVDNLTINSNWFCEGKREYAGCQHVSTVSKYIKIQVQSRY